MGTARRISTRWLVLVPSLAAALAPGAPSQVVSGLPLRPAGLLVVTGLLYAALGLPAPGRRVVGWLAGVSLAVLLLKLGLAATAPPLGLSVQYWARATPAGPAERALDRPRQTALDLRGEQFGVSFFNDASRFNFGPDVQPGRDQLPFSVRWQGWLRVPSDGPRRLVIESVGPSSLRLDGAEVLETQAAEGVQTVDATPSLSAGLHALELDYARPVARVPRLQVSWQASPGGPLETLAAPALRSRADATDATTWRTLGLLADVALAGVALGWIGLGLGAAYRHGWPARRRALLAVVPLVFGTQGMLSLAPMAGQTSILSGLDDWLVYESSARDILFNGPLMTGGQDHAAPYYGQPLYPYVLALAHALLGESLFGPLVLQFAALGGVLVGTYGLAARAFGDGRDHLAGLAALACLWVLVVAEPEHVKVARQLFNENLYMPLVMASLVATVGLARRRRAPPVWQALLLGVLLGATAISRSQFLLFVPFGGLILAIAWWRERGQRGRVVAALVMLLAGLVLAIAPITWRNWVVAGQFVPISSSGGASLLEFHRPPPGLVDQAALQRDPLFEALHLDVQTRTVLAFVRQDPRGYLATLLPLGAHSLGLPGRNDPGIDWPLFVTVLLYAASWVRPATRRLHVWPIHAFVASHLLILMLFEADTYGYRLVVPMYAPMVAVAAQLVLAGLRWLAAQSVGTRRLAPIALGLLVVAAVGQQAWTIGAGWSERETALHGLGGLAAHAARTADATDASATYVASVDGTPRRFGAGNLPGLRYPWFKWFDASRSLPLPASGSRAVYALAELQGHDGAAGLTTCLGAPDAAGEQVLDGDQVRHACVGDWPSNAALGATFEGLATVQAVRAPAVAEAGESLPADLLWQPLTARAAEPEQVSLHLEDAESNDGTQWGNGTLELYPSNEWDPSEALLSRLPVATDPTAIPQAYRLTLGMGPLRPNAAPALATWQGARVERVPVATVTLEPGHGGATLPADMQPVESGALAAGGLELIASRPLPAEAAAGGSLKLGWLWRAQGAAPTAAQAEVRVLRATGEQVQRTVLPLLGGRVAPSQLTPGSVVRDEQTLVLSPRVPSESVTLEIGLLDQAGQALSNRALRLGSLRVTGREHRLDPQADATPAEATFGQAMQLRSDQLDPNPVAAGGTVHVRLHWRGLTEMGVAYKVFVHVLDPSSAAQVVAQRDAEPQAGAAPTTSWLVGEVLDDDYAISLPAGLAPGEYPVEVGVYDPRSGTRLLLPSGDSRVLLGSRLEVRQ